MTKCMHNPGPVIIHRQGGRDGGGGGECRLCLYEIDLIPIRLYSILLISPPQPKLRLGFWNLRIHAIACVTEFTRNCVHRLF